MPDPNQLQPLKSMQSQRFDCSEVGHIFSQFLEPVWIDTTQKQRRVVFVDLDADLPESILSTEYDNRATTGTRLSKK